MITREKINQHLKKSENDGIQQQIIANVYALQVLLDIRDELIKLTNTKEK